MMDKKALPILINDARAIIWPRPDDHKHSRGRLAVVAGSQLQTGAARLSARAGQRIGAGWVSLLGTAAACEIMAVHETSILIMARELNVPLAHQVRNYDAVIIGPALGLDASDCADVMQVMDEYQGSLVLDADALTHIGSARDSAFNALKARPSPAILTPHAGEFAALFGSFDCAEKVEATLAASHSSGAIIVHKGAMTVLADPTGVVFSCDHATPFLATAGTGDVLAGMIGGLLAQGMTGLDACKVAIWVHGETGRQVGPGLIAEDLISHLPAVLAGLWSDTRRVP
jgi:hydroxyethylthiazole kinase-like uncharacterized protein yjeF